jgi:hypothetical protein
VGSDSGDLGDPPCSAELLGADVGEADMPDQALFPHFRKRGDLLLKRCVGRGWGVKVAKVGMVEA